MRCGNCGEPHDTVAQVRLCYHRNPGIRHDPREVITKVIPIKSPFVDPPWTDDDNEAWSEWKNEAARREAEDERKVYEAELKRDELLHTDHGDDGRDVLSHDRW